MRRVGRLNLGVPAPVGYTLLLVLLLVACGEPVATPEPVFLQATGSTAMSPLLSELAAAFEESSPLISLEVSGLGTQFGLEALRSGEADLALVSWLPAELDSGWRATAIARDAIAIVVHPSNPVNRLGLLQLQDLFGGRVYEWAGVPGSARALGTVQPVSREAGSGTRATFEALVMVEREVTPLAIVAPSSRAVIEYVARDPRAIGYVSIGYVTSEVKVLEVEGELPTPQTAQQASYPLTREFWLVTADPPLAAVQDFLDFVLGQAGQQIVGRRYGRIK
jgi:phosphate transport system substrate-binding protein